MDRETGHTSVLRAEATELLAPARRGVLVDCTIGAGGHAEAFLAGAGEGEGRLIGMDVDESNLLLARHRLARFGGRVRLFQANFAEIREVLRKAGEDRAAGVIADLGVASTQLDDPRRGLSFTRDGPLDMRLDPRQRTTAADIVNRMGADQLADLIFTFGQERYSRPIARAIVDARKHKPLERTVELAGIIERAVPAFARRARQGVHPATRTFQALRIAVNDELASLDALLAALPDVLAEGGVAVAISFHSLEDGRVKHAFADLAARGGWRLLTKKPIGPRPQEVAENPRSRSARLRGIQRLA